MFIYLYYSIVRNQVTVKVINTIEGKLDIKENDTNEPKVLHEYSHNESKKIVKDISSHISKPVKIFCILVYLSGNWMDSSLFFLILNTTFEMRICDFVRANPVKL